MCVCVCVLAFPAALQAPLTWLPPWETSWWQWSLAISQHNVSSCSSNLPWHLPKLCSRTYRHVPPQPNWGPDYLLGTAAVKESGPKFRRGWNQASMGESKTGKNFPLQFQQLLHLQVPKLGFLVCRRTGEALLGTSSKLWGDIWRNTAVEKREIMIIVQPPMIVHLLWSKTSEDKHERPKVEIPCLPREAWVLTSSKLLMKNIQRCGEKPEQCNECNYIFTDPRDLRRHMKAWKLFAVCGRKKRVGSGQAASLPCRWLSGERIICRWDKHFTFHQLKPKTIYSH